MLSKLVTKTVRNIGKIPLGRPRRRWVDHIRMDLEEIGINAGNWVDSAQDRNYWKALVNAALNSHGVSYHITSRMVIMASISSTSTILCGLYLELNSPSLVGIIF